MVSSKSFELTRVGATSLERRKSLLIILTFLAIVAVYQVTDLIYVALGIFIEFG